MAIFLACLMSNQARAMGPKTTNTVLISAPDMAQAIRYAVKSGLTVQTGELDIQMQDITQAYLAVHGPQGFVVPDETGILVRTPLIKRNQEKTAGQALNSKEPSPLESLRAFVAKDPEGSKLAKPAKSKRSSEHLEAKQDPSLAAAADAHKSYKWEVLA